MPDDGCVICRHPRIVNSFGKINVRQRVICDRCGTYEILQPEREIIEAGLRDQDRPIISEFVYQENKLGEEPFLSMDAIRAALSRRMLTFSERTRRMLVYLLERNSSPWNGVNVMAPCVQAALQQFSSDYIITIVRYLEEEGLLKFEPGPPVLRGSPGPSLARLTAKGMMQAEDWGQSYQASTQGFVAMWFDPQLKSAWDDGFFPAIDASGYIPRRIDNKEHVNKICDEIVAEIRKSRFVVSDFTGQRGGVYYEAGYAGGRDIPVIWTCRKSDLSGLHFDIRQYNCIDWETPEELKQRLQTRIEAVVGEGPLKRRFRG